ncbi:WD repeat-containing protein mio [Aphelenchoides bicaudatus]|nr:WD repeat-containing protein mio [Aphelenchoides bicaudatus]
MRQNLDSIVGLAFDKTTNSQSYLSCGYERQVLKILGRETEHFVSLYDVNQGKDLILDRGVSEKILGMQFLSTDLAVMMLNCTNSIRFMDIRERSGFASIMNLSTSLQEVAIEPYNNVQFVGSINNELKVFDRRFLSKALYDFKIGPNSFNISHLEWNPNRFGNITCGSSSHSILYELDILPTPTYAHHFLGNKINEPQEAIVKEYAHKFSYGLEKIGTPLSNVRHFAWCHQKPNMLVATSCCTRDTEVDSADWVQVKAVTVENSRRVVSVPPDNSIIYSDGSGFNQIKIKPRMQQKKQLIPYANRSDNNFDQLNAEQTLAIKQEKLELLNKLHLVKAKPTFELKPEEIDLLFELEQRETGFLNEKIDYDHFESKPEEVQRHIPFLSNKKPIQPPVNKSLQLWFTRSDITMIAVTRAKLGYGFATTPGSAKALIENSYYSIRDQPNEIDCLKNCWKMLARIYSSNNSSSLLARYGTVFPGVRRMAHKLTASELGFKDDKITFRNKYYASERRDDILRLIGWVPLEDRLNLAIKLERLMSTHNLRSKTRVATMAMFYLQGSISKMYLEKTALYLETTDCAIRYSASTIQSYQQMIKKMLDVIEQNDGIKIKNFEKLLDEIVDPYLNAMLIFLGRRQFNYNYPQRRIMSTDAIRLEDRLAIACIHLDDESFRHSLKSLTRSLQKSHDPLSVLLISGLDDHRYAHLALHSYLRQTNDVQTTALILCAGNCFRRSKIWETYDMRKPVILRIHQAIASNALRNTRKYSLQIVCSYLEFLQASNLTLQKSFIMTFLRKKLDFPKNDQIQAGRTQGLIACNFCGKPILPFIGCDSAADPLLAHLKMNAGRKNMSVAQTLQIAEIERRKILPKSRGCPHCGRPLPRCLICKRTCIQQQDNLTNVQMNDWFIWCSQCAHGGHLSHLKNWFSVNQLCPAAECRCACPKVDNVFNTDLIRMSIQEKSESSFFINGFNVNILSATVETGFRSRHSSEQDKMRLIRRLYRSPRQSSSTLDVLYRRGSNDSGIPLNMANPLKSICALKNSNQQSLIGSESNLISEHASNSTKNINYSSNHIGRQSLEGSASTETKRTPEEASQNSQEPQWNILPEAVKNSNAIRKLLQNQGTNQQSASQTSNNSQFKTSEDEQSKRNLITTSDNVSEISRNQRRQHIKLVPKKQNNLIRSQYTTKLKDRIDYASNNSASDANKWIINSRDSIGRQTATQVKVSIDSAKETENEPSSSQVLENNIRFNQQTVLLPAPEQSLALLSNSQALQQLISTQLFKASVADERVSNELREKRIVAQLLKDQFAKETSRKNIRERRKLMRRRTEKPKRLRSRPLSQSSSNYFSFDQYGSVDLNSDSDSNAGDSEDTKEVAKLCEKVEENCRQEELEISKLREHGFYDLSSLASALKEAEEKRKRNVKKGPKRVRIRTTPDVRVATPALEARKLAASNELNSRQRKNSSKMVPTHLRHESGSKKVRKTSSERKGGVRRTK